MLIKNFLIASFIAASISLSAIAETFEHDGVYYEITGREPATCCVVSPKNNNFTGALVIPPQVEHDNTN